MRDGPEHLTSHAEYAMPYVEGAYDIRRTSIMNSTQLGGFVRAAIAYAAGYLASKGLFPADWVGDVASLAAVMAVALWSWYSNRAPAIVDSAAEEGDVKQVVVTQDLKDQATPSPKVVTK
jgi:hypothetical protein